MHIILQYIGETWNPMKVGLQLKQVRERIAKGLVDKGVLRTEKHTFVVFDMATHPVVDTACKSDLARRVLNGCTGRGAPANLRTICLISACHAANVLDNGCLHGKTFIEREAILQKADELMRQNAMASDCASDDVREIVAGVLTVFCRLDSLLY